MLQQDPPVQTAGGGGAPALRRPILLTVRIAHADIPLGGRVIPKDATIFVMLGGANTAVRGRAGTLAPRGSPDGGSIRHLPGAARKALRGDPTGHERAPRATGGQLGGHRTTVPVRGPTRSRA
jgi:hypothetical protein